MIQYPCDCGRTLQAEAAQAGQRARCPRCGAIAAIPSRSIEDAAPPRRGEEPAKGTTPVVLILVSVLVFGLMACGGVGYTVIWPALARFAEAKEQAKEGNNFRQVGIAMHNFHDATGTLPRPAIESPDGKPLLSWRVALLPFVEQDNLYRRFRLDEPWDSDHNKRLIPMIPAVYLRPGQVPDGKTHYQAVVGRGLMFDFKYVNGDGKPSGRSMVSITDGTSNTIMFVVAKDPVIWTKPDDLDADNGMPIMPRLDARFKAGTVMALGDGSVRVIHPGVSEATLRAALSAEGGELLGPDWE
jgi:hypothetical protein